MGKSSVLCRDPAGLCHLLGKTCPGIQCPAPKALVGIVLGGAGEEDTFEFTEEEQEEGPEQLAVLEADEEVGGGPAWSPLFSSSNEHVKNQVGWHLKLLRRLLNTMSTHADSCRQQSAIDALYGSALQCICDADNESVTIMLLLLLLYVRSPVCAATCGLELLVPAKAAASQTSM